MGWLRSGLEGVEDQDLAEGHFALRDLPDALWDRREAIDGERDRETERIKSTFLKLGQPPGATNTLGTRIKSVPGRTTPGSQVTDDDTAARRTSQTTRSS